MTNHEDQNQVELMSSNLLVSSEGEGESFTTAENVGASKESVLCTEESLPVPLCPDSSEPPLEYFPFALTASRNNILYVVTETLPVPIMFARTSGYIERPGDRSSEDSNTGGSKDDGAADDESWTPVKLDSQTAHPSLSMPDMIKDPLILSVRSLPEKAEDEAEV